MPRFIFSLALTLCTICMNAAIAGPFAIHVSSDVDRVSSPVIVDLAVPAQVSADEAKAYAAGGFVLTPGNIPVQAEVLGEKVRLYWVEPELKAGKTKAYKIQQQEQLRTPLSFKFVDGDNYRDLLHGTTPIWRHDQLKYDSEQHVATYKHFHQVNDFHGNGFITQGNDGKQYPHHRGLYIGWSKTVMNGTSYDTWHCSKNVANKHKSFISNRQMTGPVVARSASIAEWTGGDGKLIVTEKREVTTWAVGVGAIVMDFDFTLSAGEGDVQLNGDPQHAGFQFRAHGTVGQTKAKYIYPASAKGKGGDVWADCAWVTNTFKIGDHGYAVAYLDHPQNPGTKEGQTVFSTRNYGRFGAFTQHKLAKDSPLQFHYRIIVLDADKHSDAMTAEHFDAAHAAFVKPVSVKIGPG